MNVILVEPAFPYNQREFARGLAAAGARVIGIGERPISHLDPELAGWLTHYEQVSSVVNEAALLAAVRRVQQRARIDRLEATVEAHIMSAAAVREPMARKRNPSPRREKASIPAPTPSAGSCRRWRARPIRRPNTSPRTASTCWRRLCTNLPGTSSATGSWSSPSLP